MTRERQAAGALLAAAFFALAASPCGCASEPAGIAPVPPTPTLPDGGDAGRAEAATNEAAAPVIPPLCKLQGPPKATAGDVLVFAEEFDGTSLDADHWNILGAADSRASTLGTFDEENVKVENGSLFVTTVKGAKAPPAQYTSGRIDTAHHFSRTYGRMDVRARFPIAPGLWYAIWARPWASAFPEIDVEILAKEAPEVWFVNHWADLPLPADERRKAIKIMTVDPTAFHVYSVIWKQDVLEFEIDGTPYMDSTRGVPTAPVSWTINTWVGAWAGPVSPTTTFPSSFEVDYLRVYRQDGLIAAPALRMTRYARHDGAPYNVPPYSARTDAFELDAANFDEACFHVEMREGNTLLAARDKPPFRFPLDVVPTGRHRFTFTATDGVRSTSVEAETTTY